MLLFLKEEKEKEKKKNAYDKTQHANFRG